MALSPWVLLTLPFVRMGWALLGAEFVGSSAYPLRVAGYFIQGRAANCSPRQILNGFRVATARAAVIRHLERTNKLLARESGMELWQTEQGRFWIPVNQDLSVFAFLLSEQATGIYGEVRPGDIVLDCGSHWGLFTRTALEQGAALVVAIDPVAQTMGCLRKTFADQIRQGRVITYQQGVWSRDALLPMMVDERRSCQNSFVLTSLRKPGPVLPVTTIDRIVEQLGLPRIDLIKMDIEGAEREALLGARETLRRFRPRLAVCTYHRPDDPLVLPEIVGRMGLGYQVECTYCREYGGFRPDVAMFRLPSAIGPDTPSHAW